MSKPLMISLGLYTALFFWYYPPICGIEDEQGFVNQTIFWSHGAISAEGAGLSKNLGDLMEVAGRHVPMRHPGRSLITLPFYLAGGYPAIFISGYLIHIAMVLLASKILGRLNWSANGAILLLFHPTLLIYSRTIMADASAGTCLLISVYVLAKPSRLNVYDCILAGLGVSLAATMRHHASAALPAVVFAVYLRQKSIRDALAVLVASAIGAVPLILLNLYVYHTIGDPYSTKRGVFDIDFLKFQIPFYVMALSVFWPLMFFSIVLVRGQIQAVMIGICSTFLAMLGCYYFHDTGTNPIQTMILGLRLMQVALPTWIIGYVVVISQRINPYGRIPVRYLNRSNLIGFQSLSLTLLSIMTILIFRAHQNQLLDYDLRRQAMLRAIPVNSLVLVEGMMPKLAGIYREDQPDYEFHLVTFDGHKSYSDEKIEAETAQSHPVHLLYSPKSAGGQPSKDFRELVEKLQAESIKTNHPQVYAWKSRKPATGSGSIAP